MSVPHEERERLHVVLDYLLNARSTLERVDKRKLASSSGYMQGWTRPLDSLATEASVFLRAVLGERLHQELMESLFTAALSENSKSTEVPATIANSLRVFLPLFMREGRYEGLDANEVIVSIVDDLMGVYWGDEPRFFAIADRWQGTHKRPFRLAKLRKTALDWDKYLKAVGVSARERHEIIARSYRTDWEAIRKWSKPIYEAFDLRSWPPDNVEYAISQFRENPNAIYEQIAQDGEAYWIEKRSAKEGND